MDKKVIYIGNFMGFGQSFDGATFSRWGCLPTIRAAASHGSAPYTVRRNEWKKKESKIISTNQKMEINSEYSNSLPESVED
jgi:hypothetical protein